jgi:hypothetical protein
LNIGLVKLLKRKPMKPTCIYLLFISLILYPVNNGLYAQSAKTQKLYSRSLMEGDKTPVASMQNIHLKVVNQQTQQIISGVKIFWDDNLLASTEENGKYIIPIPANSSITSFTLKLIKPGYKSKTLVLRLDAVDDDMNKTIRLAFNPKFKRYRFIGTPSF